MFYIFSKLTMILINSLPPKAKLFSSGCRGMEINFSNQLCKSCSPLHINTEFFVMWNGYLLLHCSAITAGKGRQQLKRHMESPLYNIHSRRRVAQGSEIGTCFKLQLSGTFIYKNYCTIWEQVWFITQPAVIQDNILKPTNSISSPKELTYLITPLNRFTNHTQFWRRW